MQQQNRRQHFFVKFASAAILLTAMLVSMILILDDHRASGVEDVKAPATAREWLIRAEHLAGKGDYENAELACRAALACQPWNPGAARKLTLLLLRRGDVEALRDWMDDLVLGDARLTERLFQMPEFEPYMDDPVLGSSSSNPILGSQLSGPKPQKFTPSTLGWLYSNVRNRLIYPA